MVKTGIGQDSHRFGTGQEGRSLVLGGVVIPVDYYLQGNSDADVILHAVTNGISGITGNPVLGEVADDLLQKGFTDSRVYLDRALADLQHTGYRLAHVSISVECQKPKLAAHFPAMRSKLAEILELEMTDVALTATSGEGLTDFGRGLGIQALAVVTALRA